MAAPTGAEPARQLKRSPWPQLQPRGRGSGGGRAAYFARREAARVLREVLRGDARRSATGTIKSLVYDPSVRNKKGTFALVCQTLKCLSILKKVLEASGVLTGKWKRQQELLLVTAYDVLMGQKSVTMEGAVEKFLLQKEKVLQIELAKLCVEENVKRPEELINKKNADTSKPRYVRVNTLKIDVEYAIRVLEKDYMVKKDDMLSDLLLLPAGTDLHDHQLVTTGSILLQGKASSMPTCALNPKPGSKVLDACAAPGNKTIQLSALMEGRGIVIACELNEKRVRLLEDTIKRSGAPNVEVFHGDFLNINPMDSMFSQVEAILLDPSCSGSGIAAERLDHLLPSNQGSSETETGDDKRVKNLSAFQKKALTQALSFPSVERIVYSTCSIHQAENEDVVASVLDLASSKGFELVAPFPRWPRRGLPTFEGWERLLRTSPDDNMEGFFIALFVRRRIHEAENRRHKVPQLSGLNSAMFTWKLSHWSHLLSLRRRRRKL